MGSTAHRDIDGAGVGLPRDENMHMDNWGSSRNLGIGLEGRSIGDGRDDRAAGGGRGGGGHRHCRLLFHWGSWLCSVHYTLFQMNSNHGAIGELPLLQ